MHSGIRPAPAGVDVETRDISPRPGRVIATFNGQPHRGAADASATISPSWDGSPTIHSRPTSSSCRTSAASVPQLKAAIEELQAKRLRRSRTIPDEPQGARGAWRSGPATTPSREVGRQPGAARGQLRPASAASCREGVRQGNNPHRMGEWVPRQQDPCGHDGSSGDFRSNEQSITAAGGHGALAIEHVDASGRDGLGAQEGRRCSPVRWSTAPSCHKCGRCVAFLDRAQIADARKAQGVLFSPPHEGHDDEGLRPNHLRPRRSCLLRRRVRRSMERSFDELGVDPNNGFGDLVVSKIGEVPPGTQRADDRSRYPGRLRKVVPTSRW